MPDSAPNLVEEVVQLQNVVKKAVLPPELKERALAMTNRLNRMIRFGEYSVEYERTANYIDWITNLPWDKSSQDNLDLQQAKKILDKNHYGLTQIKDRVLEYLAVLKLKQVAGRPQEEEGIMKFMRAPILSFFGLVGTGKTTIAYSIAEAMGRQFVRIPLGGMGDPLDLRGQSRARPDAEPGLIIKALRRVGTNNPVILLDELDRLTDEGRSSVMGVLVELLDPEQNMAFRDHFLDYPFDLSKVLFIATANNAKNISTAVMDRLEPMQMPSYTDEEKIAIAKNYVLNRTMSESGLPADSLMIDPEVWPKIVRPLGYDAGIRTLERTVNGICRRVAKTIVETNNRQIHLTLENIKDYLPNW